MTETVLKVRSKQILEPRKLQFAGEWGYCDDCMFSRCCHRLEKREGYGCPSFVLYPYELPFVDKRQNGWEVVRKPC